MSRIGKKEIIIPTGVTVDVTGNNVLVRGPKGELTCTTRPEIEVTVTENVITSVIKKDTNKSDAFWGLTRALINNMILGVTTGFEKKMELVGVGYRVKTDGDGITLTVGYSHPVHIAAPKGIHFIVDENNKLTITGYDKQLVGQVAANIRAVRKPEPYKGKGIKYANEVIRRKAGKSGKK